MPRSREMTVGKFAFPASGGWPLLAPMPQFGTRLSGGASLGSMKRLLFIFLSWSRWQSYMLKHTPSQGVSGSNLPPHVEHCEHAL